MSRFRVFAIGLVLAAAVFPCAIDDSPRFVPGRIPEKVDARFVRGELGILTPDLGARYQLIAWRYLAGMPLSSDEQAALVTKPADTADAALNQWQTATSNTRFLDRSKSSRVAPNEYYVNCLDDAFLTATATLADRRTKYGNDGNDALTRNWIAAQDQVFSNCSAREPAYPADPDASMPPLARADRMYQIAAAHFYAEDFDGARERFEAIARDQSSPWRVTARYMIGRVLLREYTLLNKSDAAALARQQFASVASDADGGKFQKSAEEMVQFVDTMLDPMTEYKSLSKRLTASGPEFARSLDEATYVVEVQRFAPALADPAVPPPFDWLHAMKAGPPTNALRRWKETHSELWLVPAMIHSNAKDADVPALLEAAAKVPETSPAYDTVNYHSVRLVSESGKADQARAMLDKLLAGKPGPLASVDNAFRGQRLALATSFDDFLRWAPRRPIGIGDESIDPGDVSDAPLLDSDSIDVLNLSTPLQKLAEAAHSSRLPPATAEDVARVALTRAILLGDDAVAASVSPVVAGAHPDWAGDLNAFNEATGVSKRFAASLLIERHSQFRTDVSNMGPDISTWWCAQGPYERRPILLASTVLSPEEKQEAAQQLNRIHGAGPAQAFVAPAVMAWAAAHPADPEIPEAVHRVVEMTRYGCRGIPEINGPISKAAFDLLHRKYPDSEWTKKTPYWFKD